VDLERSFSPREGREGEECQWDRIGERAIIKRRKNSGKIGDTISGKSRGLMCVCVRERMEEGRRPFEDHKGFGEGFERGEGGIHGKRQRAPLPRLPF
jgi:hypothetical protein